MGWTVYINEITQYVGQCSACRWSGTTTTNRLTAEQEVHAHHKYHQKKYQDEQDAIEAQHALNKDGQ